MKSIVNNVVGMATAVACLSLILNRPVGAEDNDKPEVEKKAHVVVVQAESGENVAEAVKKALAEKLKDMPEDVRKRIEQKLQAVKEGSIDVDVKVLNDELIKKAEGAAAGEKAQAIRIAVQKKAEAQGKVKEAQEKVAQAKKVIEAKVQQIAEAGKKAGEGKAIAIAVAVDDDEVSAKDGVKEFTVKIENGKVLLNGKPIADVKIDKPAEVRVNVQQSGEGEGQKVTRRKMLFMGEDGKVQELEFKDLDVNVEAHGIVVGTPDKNQPHVMVIRQHAEHKEGEASKPQIRVEARKIVGGKPGAAEDVVVLHAEAQAAKVHADVTKRLANIESELKKIRQLLQKMQNGDDDDEHEHAHEEDDD